MTDRNLTDATYSNRAFREVPNDQIQHVYPNFGREHVTDQREKCWCGPRVELVDGGAIIIHEVEQ